MLRYYLLHRSEDKFVLTAEGEVYASGKDISDLAEGVRQSLSHGRIAEGLVYCGSVEDSELRKNQNALSPEERSEFWRLLNK